MTQAQLAQAARMSRPNLSAVERGDREVTLRTLRQLALALDVRPGILADGIAPTPGRPLGRRALERIAGGAAGRGGAIQGIAADDADEARFSALLTKAAAERLASVAARSGRAARKARRPSRRGDRAYFLLKSATSPETVASLVDRLSGPGSPHR